ncbi:putative ribonuclease H-like domain-containing protein, partial [Tanacetum coccineum]
KGPTWLFDLDYLTDSMNYQPVRVENQANKTTGLKETNHSVGTQDNIVAGNSELGDKPAQEYYVLPSWSSYTSTIKSSEIKNGCDKPKQDTGLKTNEKPVDKEEQSFLEELERLKRQEKEAHYEFEALRQEFAQGTENLLHQTGAKRACGTKTVNAVSTPVSTASPSRVFSVGELSSPDHGIFSNTSYDDEGVVADFTNLDTTMNVSPIPTSRIHTIHPKTQILRDPTLAVQTRSKVNKSSRAHALLNLRRYLKLFNMQAVLMLCKKNCCSSSFRRYGFMLICLMGRGQLELTGSIGIRGMKERIGAIMIFLAFASNTGFIVNQMDVKSAFLYGTFDEEVYVSQPLASRAWYATLSTFLEQSGYRRGTMDKNLFIKNDKKDIMLIQVYVDDIIFDSTKKSWCDEFKTLMKNMFQMSSLGELTFFLGLQVKQKEDGIFISQDKYVVKILKKFDFMSVKHASTPNETHKPLVKDEEAADVDVHLYRSVIGSLMYLTASRPDIMFAVCACSRFQVTPKTSHLHDVKIIFRHLKGNPKLGLWYPRESSVDLVAYSDSNYSGANLDKKSTTGEAEYVAAANCCGQFWMSAKSKTINNVRYITAKVTSKPVTISEASIRGDPLFDDADGIDSLNNQAIFDTIQDEGEASERPSESHIIPSPPHPSDDQPEAQTDLSPKPSPSIPIPDSILEGSSGNHGGQSSTERSLLGNEDGLTLQSVYGLYVSLCTQTSKKEIYEEKVDAKRVCKSAKSKPTTHKDQVFDDLDDFDGMDYMETDDAYSEKGESTKDKVSTDKPEVNTDKPKVSTDKPKVSTDQLNVSTDKLDEGTTEPKDGYSEESATLTAPTTTSTPTPTIFRDDETIAEFLVSMSQNKAKQKGVEIKDAEYSDRPRPTSTRSVLTLKPLPKIDPKDKGKKVFEEEAESDAESEGVNEAERKFAQLANDEEVARKVQEGWEAEEEKKILAEEEAIKATLIRDYDDIQARIEADSILAARLQEEEREKFTIKERAKLLHDTIFTQRRSAEDERIIRELNKKVAGTKKADSIMEECKEEADTRKRKLALDEDKEVDYEILDRKYPIKEWTTEYLGFKPPFDETKGLEKINLNVVIRSNGQRRYFSALMRVLSIFDREDLNDVYKLIMDRYQNEVPKEKKYPLKKKVLLKMLELKLESEEDSTIALELIRFVKKIIAELESENTNGNEENL